MDRKEMDKILKEFHPDKLGKRANELVDKIEKEKKTLKEAAGITDEMENEVYVLAKHYYEQGKYREAYTIFEALCRISPAKFPYIYGLASSYYQARDYIQASLGFYTAFTLDPTNPMPPFYLADCMLNLNAKEDAKGFLDLTIGIAQSRPEKQFAALAERCKLIKASLTTEQPPVKAKKGSSKTKRKH